MQAGRQAEQAGKQAFPKAVGFYPQSLCGLGGGGRGWGGPSFLGCLSAPRLLELATRSNLLRVLTMSLRHRTAWVWMRLMVALSGPPVIPNLLRTSSPWVV